MGRRQQERKGVGRRRGGWAGRFLRQEEGYALTLTLISLPFLLGVAAWIIDAARVTNLNTDLQDAVDAMALAGARELDGRDDAISRAKTAITNVKDASGVGNVAWFGNTGGAKGMGSKFEVSYDAGNDGASDVSVYFLSAIPDDDDTPISPSGCSGNKDYVAATTEADCRVKGGDDAEKSNNAKYVRVVAKAVNVDVIFSVFDTKTVPVNAEAVATYTAAACDVTPIFICNPFESSAGNPLANGKTFNENFADGNLYGRQITMNITGSASPAPGNFGFLRVEGTQGAHDLGTALATGNPGVCYTADGVDTKTGGNIGPVEQGINTRLGIYAGSYNQKSGDVAFRPDINTRKGQKQNGKNLVCNKYDPEANELDAMPFPAGTNPQNIGGGTVSSNTWDIAKYWDISHVTHAKAPSKDSKYVPPTSLPTGVNIPRSSLPAGATVPTGVISRYDVYRYEIDNELYKDAAPNGETGNGAANQCYTGTLPGVNDERRTIFAAVLNCAALAASGDLKGQSEGLPVEAFASMFMTKPMTSNGNDKAISLEITDVTGAGGRGTLENFLREEAELVR